MAKPTPPSVVEAMRRGISVPQLETKAPPPIDMNAIHDLLSSPDLDDVEFDDEELDNDADLLADLASIESGGELRGSSKEVHTTTTPVSIPNNANQSTLPSKRSSISTPNASLELESLDSPTNFDEETLVAPNVTKVTARPQHSQSTPSVPSDDNTQQPRIKSIVQSNPQLAALALKQTDIVENRWLEYKEAIEYCRSQGDVQSEKKYTMAFQTLSAFLRKLKEGTPIDLRKLPAAPSITLAVPMDIDEHDQERLIAFETFEKTVRDQIKMLHEKAMSAKEKGDKVTAVTLFREQKEMMSHLQKITTAKQSPGVPLPKYQFEDAQYSEEITFQHLADNMLEIEIVKGITLKPPAGQETVDSYAVLIFPYPTELPQRIQTSTIDKTINPQYNWRRAVKIERKKSFLLTVERKKVVAEIFHSRWFGKDISLGKAEIKMTDLTSKAEVREIANVMDGRRATGGQLEVIFRLRKPLLKSDIRTVKYKKLVILQHFLPEDANNAAIHEINPVPAQRSSQPSLPSQIEAPPSKARPVSIAAKSQLTSVQQKAQSPQQLQKPQVQSPQPAQIKAQPTHPQPQPQPQRQPQPQPQLQPQPQPQLQPQPQPQPQQPQPQPQQSQQPKPQAPKQATPQPTKLTKETQAEEDEGEDYNSLENMISNNVLTWELNNVQKKIDSCKASSQPAPPELIDRMQMIEARMQILVLQVQTGKITEQSYATMLKSKINDEKQQAKNYLQKENKDAARLALQRAKIMEQELQEAGM